MKAKINWTRFFAAFIFLTAAFVIQSTLFYHMRIGYGTCDLLVIMVSSMGFIRGSRAGMYAGLYTGFLLDLYSDTYFGFYMLIFLIIGYFCGIFRNNYYADDIKLPILLIAAADLFYHFFIYVTIFLLHADTSIGIYLKSLIMPSMTYTVCVALIVNLLMHLGNKFIEKYERKSRKSFV